MENENALKEKYSSVPNSIRSVRRWVCYKLEPREGKITKIPINAMSGKFAKVDDKLTWTDFDTAIMGCEKYGCNGIGFVLGNGIFGVDLDNHGEMSDEEFNELADEFINALDSYTEYSQSGKGVHIICYGTLPNTTNQNGEIVKGRRRKGNVEMYDNARFFAFTGNAIKNKAIEDRTNEIIPLWKKYVDDTEERLARIAARPVFEVGLPGAPLDDDEVIETAMKAKNGLRFSQLMGGDLSIANGDHSKADMMLCNMLAFWTNCDYDQIDRIFRRSGLMRDKWDTMRGGLTYGEITISQACKEFPNGGYVRQSKAIEEPIVIMAPHEPVVEDGKADMTTENEIQKMRAAALSSDNFMNVDSNGNPIFRTKYVVGKGYSYTDIGNAQRFYDYFGDLFKYNVDMKMFMFWTGKTWIYDSKSIIRKYATKLIEILQAEIDSKEAEVSQLIADGDKESAKALNEIVEAAKKNKTRLSNKAGRDAMLAELQAIGDIPVFNSDFDSDPFLLNTENGIVNLKTGMISVFDREKMLSKNTNCPIDYSEPKVWLEFLNGVFYRGESEEAKKETQEIIDYIQQASWYSLTGSTREQVMFLLYGNGSNGKTTYVEQMRKVLGDYGSSKESSILMASQGKGQSASTQFSLAELVGVRYLIAEETNEGEKLDEGGVKAMTGSGKISAQKKYGNPFEFYAQFKIWLLTNNLPIIRGADFGIWRRLVPIPFLRRFTEKEKDMDMPEKLAKETAQILGWCVQGHEKYQANGNRLIMPECIKSALRVYQDDMDVVAKFIKKCCKDNPSSQESCKIVFNAYKNWAMDNKEYILRESKFCESMVGKGYKIGMLPNGDQCYEGVEILSSWRSSNNQQPKATSSFYYDED